MNTSMKIFAVLALVMCAIVLISDAREHQHPHPHPPPRNGAHCDRGKLNKTETVNSPNGQSTKNCTCRQTGPRHVLKWNCTAWANQTTTTTTTTTPVTTISTTISTTTVAGG